MTVTSMPTPLKNSSSDNLIQFISTAHSAPLSDAVIEKTKHHIVDTMAAIISGIKLHVGIRALSVVPAFTGREEALVVGTNIMLPAYAAAMINAMLAHADETDDSHASAKFHPGCGIIPSALALAQQQGASGVNVIRAVALGYDVGARTLETLGPMPLNMAGHASHAFGPLFGCGAVAGYMLGFDAQKNQHLLSYLGHEVSGLSCWMSDTDHIQKAYVFGAMAAKNALFVALLCQHEWTGCEEVIAAERGLLAAYGNSEHGRTLEEPLVLGDEILHSDIKKWCVGSPIQAPLDSLEAMLASIPEDVSQIKSIEVEIQANEVFIVEARLMPNISLQHLLALFLVDRQLTFSSVHDVSRMNDSAILALRARVKLIPNLELQRSGGRQAIVRVFLNNGDVLSHHTPRVRGTWENAMRRDEVHAKAHELIEPIMGKQATTTLLNGLWNLEKLDAEELTALIQSTALRV
jgi:2-methylcitrate dehydratase PrpD